MALMAQNPDDTQQQMMAAYGMAAPPSAAMMAPVDPHASLTAPISAAPPEPPPMMGSSSPAPVSDKPARMSALQPEQDQISNKLMADYKKDNDPYGSPDNHPGFTGKLLHGLSMAGNIAGDIASPTLMSRIPGTDLHRQIEERVLQSQLQSIAKDESEEGLQGAETAGREESTQEAPQKAADAHDLSQIQQGNIQSEQNARDNPTPEFEIHDTANGPLFVNKQTGAAQHLSVNGAPIGPKIQTKTVQLEVGGKPHQVLINEADGTPIKDLGLSGEKPPTTNVNEGTWSLQNNTEGKPLLFNSKTGETKEAPANLARKPNAEEQKRADLATNVNENLDKLEDIANRRPDLFGPVAGRMTKMREMVGTDDPDVATLKTLEDNLGMAMQSAHGMRSAQHVETSAQSVLNGFKNSPQALKAAIKAARASVGTFQNNVQDTNDAGKPSAAQGLKAGDVEGGYRFKGGDPAKQSNWEKSQ